MPIEIVDRVDTAADMFIVEPYNTNLNLYRIKPAREPEVAGTPLNKELLQPLFDAHAGVDISNDYITEKYDSVDSYEVSVYLHGNLIVGNISINLNTNIQIGEILKINSKYVPLQQTILCCAMANGLNVIMKTVPVFIGDDAFVLYDADIQDSLYVSFVYTKGE